MGAEKRGGGRWYTMTELTKDMECREAEDEVTEIASCKDGHCGGETEDDQSVDGMSPASKSGAISPNKESQAIQDSRPDETLPQLSDMDSCSCSSEPAPGDSSEEEENFAPYIFSASPRSNPLGHIPRTMVSIEYSPSQQGVDEGTHLPDSEIDSLFSNVGKRFKATAPIGRFSNISTRSPQDENKRENEKQQNLSNAQDATDTETRQK